MNSTAPCVISLGALFYTRSFQVNTTIPLISIPLNALTRDRVLIGNMSHQLSQLSSQPVQSIENVPGLSVLGGIDHFGNTVS